MYKIKSGAVYNVSSPVVQDDLQLLLTHINDNNYKIEGKSIYTQRGKTNIIDKCFMAVATQFKAPFNEIMNTFIELVSSKNIVKEAADGDNLVCTNIPKPIPALMPVDMVNQFNEVKKINIDPCTYEYSREVNGSDIPMTVDEYKSSFKAYVVEYNRCCDMWWELIDGKKVTSCKSYAWKNINNLNPQIEVNNYDFERGARRVIRAKLGYDGTPIANGLGLVIEYLTAMKVPESVKKFETLGLKNSYRTICAYALMHWLWLVKRNLHDNPKTTEHLFLNVYGGQGSGKSTFVQTLGNGLQYFYAEADVKKIEDPRESKIWANKRIVFFDEFGSKAELSHDEMTAMKKLITTDKMQLRIMGTNEHTVIVRKFSGVSATNVPISDIVKDKTGARRYFEIITNTEYNAGQASHFDFGYLDGKKVQQENGMEAYEDIWRVVDDSLESGYLSMFEGMRDDIRKIQSTYVPLSSSLQFMQSEECRYVAKTVYDTPEVFHLKFNNEDAYQVLGITDLYNKYLLWCKANNQDHAKTMKNFKSDIESLDILIKTEDHGFRSDGAVNKRNLYYIFTGS